jgi:hypothetical protein
MQASEQVAAGEIFCCWPTTERMQLQHPLPSLSLSPFPCYMPPCAYNYFAHRLALLQVSEQIAAGENVVLLANHQTEADPGVFAHMLAHSFPNLATDVIYVAGDRVVTDPLCKPFSMGRNLFCVHSKKHMDDVPELKAAKMETNRKTLVAMQRAFNKGKPWAVTG